MEYTLYMKFDTSSKTEHTVSISHVREDIDSVAISQLMSTIIESGLFVGDTSTVIKGSLTGVISAWLVAKEVTDYSDKKKNA